MQEVSLIRAYRAKKASNPPGNELADEVSTAATTARDEENRLQNQVLLP